MWYVVCITEWVSGEELSTTMLIIGIWAQKGSAGQKILEKLGINDDKIAKLSDTVSATSWLFATTISILTCIEDRVTSTLQCF